MNPLAFVVGIFTGNHKRNGEEESIREAARNHVRWAAGVYADEAEKELSQVLFERQQRVLGYTADSDQIIEVEPTRKLTGKATPKKRKG